MTELNILFRKRIGISEDENIGFEKLEHVLEKTAQSIPFENLCIIENKTYEITKENLINKILVRNEGGLCYELNAIFYFFLIENGFNAFLVRGGVYNNETQAFQQLGRTHVTILVNHEGQTYLIDTGFGGNLPLKLVPLTGESVTSKNGEFRIKKENSVHGDHILEMKLKHKDTDWKIGYAFDSSKPVADISELNEIQTIICEHPKSPFNKNPLISLFTDSGKLILTNTSFTQRIDGVITKNKMNNKKFKELAKQHFGIQKDSDC
ncbi:arylamine N-acetyltransferase [Bacillus aquiflavi]|uniref:Arylamine N-acetyltransferase n=1 Tax=Bacillus aquiflavi TaxID=2672567 RepID=A0A6B3VWW6_9BACI|nr:arylamine N-acetyltransferase [Bacillus aquiflavi]MBA4536399.1 arylamine N-acetyltransferase [Bacillus aquiflavi]NEY80767.1 arylamine N-acetyltransferase [Bacillus aquiflavi]UAC49141.1 arylamine N-acetyltransferase [Bacillus aquiflavi]